MSNVAAEKVFLAGIVQQPAKLFEYVEYLESKLEYFKSTMRYNNLGLKTLQEDRVIKYSVNLDSY